MNHGGYNFDYQLFNLKIITFMNGTLVVAMMNKEEN
jgi:hypothetical protein